MQVIIVFVCSIVIFCKLLIIDSFKAVIDNRVLFVLNFKNSSVQVDIFYTGSLSIDNEVSRHTLCSILYHILFVSKAISLRSKFNNLGKTILIMFVLEYWFLASFC